ncbi:MAG: LysR substrate-binding domain-containing protein [Alphaproteobacteria bacterium]
MNLRDLKYIRAVSDLQHFGKAAAQCHVSQPTLSGQIKKLEDELGLTLFERTSRRVIPTDIGLKIVANARRILQEVDSIYELAEQSRTPFTGKFRLGAFPTLASYIFPSLVHGIKQLMPGLNLILLEEKTADLVTKLKNGQIDCALLATPVEDELLEWETLFTDEFVVATPPDHVLASCVQIRQDMLDGHNLLLLEEGHCLRDQALEVCQFQGLQTGQDFRATSLETLRQMVKAGSGITLMPKIAVSKNEIGIHYVPFEPPAPSRTIGLYWRKTTTKRAVIEQVASLLNKHDNDS